MNLTELKKAIEDGALAEYSNIYEDTEKEKSRFLSLISEHENRYGNEGEVMLLSVPGRSEIAGNHTDHNLGSVIATAIDKDAIAIAKKNGTNTVRLYSEGYGESVISLDKINNPENFKKYSSAALIAGVIDGFIKRGCEVFGFDACISSNVPEGSGISSSAAYEVMIGNIVNQLYNGAVLNGTQLAKIAQYAENVYFGKPCGLMDQTACAVGGFVYIDFKDRENPSVEPIDFSLTDYGYAVAIINTGASHENLNEDYASVPQEMRAVAQKLGGEYLASFSESDVIENIKSLRESVGDRAILRALHFYRENERVEKVRTALKDGDLSGFFDGIRKSGASSFQYLQNVYTNQNVKEQGLSLALALADKFLGDDGAFRVHGGGFAGTVQLFVKKEKISALKSLMDGVFGENSTMILNIRPLGAVRLF